MFLLKRFTYIPGPSLVAIVILIFLTGCGSSLGGQPNQMGQTGQVNQATLVLDLSVDLYEFNTPANMCQAPMIADVIAGSVGPSHWNTTNKAQPAFLSQAMPTIQMKETLIKGGYMIYMPIQFTSMNILLDHRSVKQLPAEFVMEGGQQGTTKMSVGEYPLLKTSTRYLVVFVPGLNASTHALTQQWQLAYNAFPIDAHGMVTLQRASSPNEPGVGQPQPEVKITLTALQQQLAACH
ncbi:MAG: hypothetical protein ABI456_15655 [Ktedonobacteraceae bacterium]